MARKETVKCAYCSTLNPRGKDACLACGAPMEDHKDSSSLKIQPQKPVSEVKPQKDPQEELKKVGEKVDETYFTVLHTYAIAWRTLAETISIGVTSLIIGAAGGAVGMGFLGILGGIALGIAVGFTQKSFYLTLASAPGGAMIGVGVGAIFWLGGMPQVFPLIVATFSIFGAVIGGRRQPALAHRNWWEKLRPLFGGLGGLAFGILGTLLGWGIISTIRLFQ